MILRLELLPATKDHQNAEEKHNDSGTDDGRTHDARVPGFAGEGALVVASTLIAAEGAAEPRVACRVSLAKIVIFGTVRRWRVGRSIGARNVSGELRDFTGSDS